jgi:hypothetical protein
LQLQSIKPDWTGHPCVVAASGPSLTPEVAKAVRMARWLNGWKVVCVNDAWQLMPLVDILYACDERWWRAHGGAAGFAGEKWTTHEKHPHTNSKDALIADYPDINLVAGGDGPGFSDNPAKLHYGSNSGFQAVNLALLKGVSRIVLVGFDMRLVEGKRHFFGDHPKPLFNRNDYNAFIPPFKRAAKTCQVPIVNATPGSALDCFPMVELADALRDGGLYRNRAFFDAGTDRRGAAEGL